MALVIATLAAYARLQTPYWHDSEALWTHTLACTPDNFVAHNNLAVALADQGGLDEAIEHYERAIQLKSGYVGAYVNLGIVLARQGRSAEAIVQYERAILLNPELANAHISPTSATGAGI
jgi:tetratricopeptide (TPR) repeat protein